MRVFPMGLLAACEITAAITVRPASAEEMPAPQASNERAELAHPVSDSDEAVVREGVSFGYGLHRFQDDFGMSLFVSTPTFANESIRVTGGGGLAWYPYGVGGNGDQTWLPYYHGRLVVEGGHRIQGTPLRLYGVGGVISLFTPDRLASDLVHIGGYGAFGFEFLMPKNRKDGPVSYFIELGGIGTGARADNLLGKPILANGFLITVGLRLYP